MTSPEPGLFRKAVAEGVATALLLSAWLADGSVTQWLVGAYVIGMSEIIVISLLLSLGSRPILSRTKVSHD